MRLIITLLGGAFAITSVSAQTIVQTESIAAYTASGSRSVSFDRFDTLGGTRELTGVSVSFTFDKVGGSYAIDNDSSEFGNITFFHELRARLTSTDVSLGSNGTYVSALSEFTTVVGADNGDPQQQFDSDTAGNDYVLFTPNDILGTGNSANIASGLWGAYTGSGQFGITFQALQSFSTDGVGGLQSQTISSTVSPTVTVIYNYQPVIVPEPQIALLGLLGVMPLLRRVRRRNA